MTKALTIDGHNVRLTRRRYGTQTYCWGEVHHGGNWYDLGEPWPSVTPKRAELEASVRERVALARSKYDELVDLASPLLKAYRDDLYVHDRDLLLKANGLPYLHWTRMTGTMLTVLWPAGSDHYPAPGVKIPYLFGFADRDKVLRDESVNAEHSNSGMSLPTLLVLYFNGKTLLKITTDRAVEIVKDYQKSIRHQWERQGRRS